jgi:hypothetical protein
MSRFDLLHDADNALSRVVDADDLVAALFQDHPDLISFEVSVTSEYDDNNYSDYSRVVKVNGWRIDYDGEYEEYEEDEEDEESDLPKASREAIEQVMNVPEYVREKWGHGDHDFHRDVFGKSHATKPISERADALCAIALLSGERVSVDTLVEAGGRWALHHAALHGRYSPEDEFRLFAQEDMMGVAMNYARVHGPLSDKTLNYFILSLKSDDYGYEQLQEYLEWLKGKAA